MLQLLCLLLVFNGKVERSVDVEFVEVFAGVGEISRACRAQGMVGSSHDIQYSSHFDLCNRCGFLYPGLSFRGFILELKSIVWHFQSCASEQGWLGNRLIQ